MPIRPSTPQPTAAPTASPFAASPFDDGGRITCAPRPAFFLRAHPLAWEVVDVEGAPVWVPQLSRHELLPGAQGIRTLTRAEQGDPRLAWRAARQQQEGEGFVYLDPTAEIDPRFRPEGIDAATYCYAIPCIDRQRRPGVRFTELWEVPIPTPPGMSQVFRFDHDLANAWRASLVADGLVPQPNPLIMEREIRRARQRLARAQAAAPSAARDVKVATVEAEVERHEAAQVPAEAPAPAPTPRKRRGASQGAS
ncbi:MAG: hypothetical protein CL625_00280 [Arenimonas sp.]|nr:hypothetical protein [Arenimonas sp.]